MLQIDQDHLETVIPSLEGPVMLLEGRYRGCIGVLKAINEKKYSVQVLLSNGELVDGVEYEHVSKVMNTE